MQPHSQNIDWSENLHLFHQYILCFLKDLHVSIRIYLKRMDDIVCSTQYYIFPQRNELRKYVLRVNIAFFSNYSSSFFVSIRNEEWILNRVSLSFLGCKFVFREFHVESQELVAVGVKINRAIVDECKLGLRDQVGFEAFKGRDIFDVAVLSICVKRAFKIVRWDVSKLMLLPNVIGRVSQLLVSQLMNYNCSILFPSFLIKRKVGEENILVAQNLRVEVFFRALKTIFEDVKSRLMTYFKGIARSLFKVIGLNLMGFSRNERQHIYFQICLQLCYFDMCHHSFHLLFPFVLFYAFIIVFQICLINQKDSKLLCYFI